MRLTTLCYIEKDDCFLMLYRNKKKDDQSQGKWLGVGGKFEAGETPDECMLREVFEETGLRLGKYHFHGVVSFISDVWEDEYMFLYTATEFEGKLPDNCSEGELKWIPKEDVLSLSLWEGDRIFLKQLIDHEEHIDLKLVYEGYDLVKAIDHPGLKKES